MKPTLFLALLLSGCEAHVQISQQPNATNTPAISTNKDALNGLSEQVHGLINDFKRTQETAQYWHDAYYKHLALVHQGPGLLRLDMQLAESEGCNPGGIFIMSEGIADFPPLAQIVMPCGYVWELRWGDRVPETDVPCPCGNPDHWVFKFEHSDKEWWSGAVTNEVFELHAK